MEQNYAVIQGKGYFVHMAAAVQDMVVVRGIVVVQDIVVVRDMVVARDIAVVQGILAEAVAVDQGMASWEKHKAVPLADPGRVN